VPYAYGRQVGGEDSRFSECRIFRKYYPDQSAIPQNGFFCNNANATLSRAQWEATPFDEQLTGLEDMALAKRITESGAKIGYVADATVYHLHDETWRAIKNRFEREAIALQSIMPQVHITFGDFLRYWASAVLLDLGAALQDRKLLRNASQIVAYRYMQFLGSYRGNNEHRRLSQAMKDKYFFPK
jgi:GT2 family glycosyltransferase